MLLVICSVPRKAARNRPDAPGVEHFEQACVRHQARHAPVSIRERVNPQQAVMSGRRREDRFRAPERRVHLLEARHELRYGAGADCTVSSDLHVIAAQPARDDTHGPFALRVRDSKQFFRQQLTEAPMNLANRSDCRRTTFHTAVVDPTLHGELLLRARALAERLQSLPRIRGVTISENGLFSGTDSRTESLQVEGFDAPRPENRTASFDQVGPGYFRTLGATLLAGREFDERDNQDMPPVAIINEAMATAYFGRHSPLGRYIQNGGDRYTIVGVVKDNRQQALKGKTERRFYLALLQTKDPVVAWNFEIRTTVDSGSVVPAVRREVQTFDPNLRVLALEPVRTLIAQTISNDRAVAQLSGLFGALAVLLAVAGLYGVVSYTMSRRTGEIGLRMALGADRASVIGIVLRETLVLVVGGLALGVPIALVSSRLTAVNLSDVSPHDPLIVATALLVMLVAGLCAGIVPAIRAAQIDPVKALQQE